MSVDTDRLDALADLNRRHAVVLQALSFAYKTLSAAHTTHVQIAQVRAVIREAGKEATR